MTPADADFDTAMDEKRQDLEDSPPRQVADPAEPAIRECFP